VIIPDLGDITGEPDGSEPWSDALTAAAVFAIDPRGVGGVRLRSAAGPIRDAWFEKLREFLDSDAPLRKVPCQVADARLLGGLDLAATLRAGRPVVETGLLAASDGGILAVQMAERLPPASGALIAAAMDEGAVHLERDGFSLRLLARIAVVLCDEGIEADEQPAAALLDRVGFWIDLSAVTWRQVQAAEAWGALRAAHLQQARAQFASVTVPAPVGEALCAACAALGIDSLRVPLLALRVARAAAALDGLVEVGSVHAAFAARLVIAPRARVLPMPVADDSQAQSDAQQTPEPPEGVQQAAPPEPPPDQDEGEETGAAKEPLAEMVLAAAKAALPPDLLAQLSAGVIRRGAGGSAGRTGLAIRSKRRGRPVGTRRGELRGGARLHVLETLRAAAPWQKLRRHAGPSSPGRRRIEVRREDFRVVRFRQRSQTTVIFLVDASGSAAMHRLAEAKGAVELFLADCYVRRDQVALIAFGGRGAELLLPPTRSLARARRCLAGIPGGGGTPVAAGLRCAAAVADTVRRRGDIPLVVMLTDGKANIALNGDGGRARAGDDAMATARVLRGQRLRSLLVDFSPRPQETAQRLAQELGANYLALPHAHAASLADAVRVACREPG